MTVLRVLWLALGLLVVGVGPVWADLLPGDYSRTLSFDGFTRDYDIHVPPTYTGGSAVPLVIDFHGLGSNKVQQGQISGFRARSDAEGFILVHPQGLFNSWNGGTCCGTAQSMGIDDVGFVRAMVASVQGEVNIDPVRIYATGLSNGGAMTHRLACEAADLFAAAAPLAFPVPFFPSSQCRPSRDIAVLTFMGLTDQTVSYVFAQPTLTFWRDTNSCAGSVPDVTTSLGNSFCESYLNCSSGVEVGLCSIDGILPPPFDGHVIYFNNDGLVLSQIAWDFLSRFQLPRASGGLDSFKCYLAKDLENPTFVATSVSLSDQFGVNDGDFEVKKPQMVCNPVDVDGAGIQNAAGHLTCYKVRGPKLLTADRPKLRVVNQFGTLDLAAKKAFLVCVPSSKTVLP